MNAYAVGFPVRVDQRRRLAGYGWRIPEYTGDTIRPCGACGERLLLLARSWAMLQARRMPLLCAFCAEDRRITRPMSRRERELMLAD